MTKTANWTCNVKGNCVYSAKAAGFHAYHANGVTAVEVKAASARAIASRFGEVLYVFE